MLISDDVISRSGDVLKISNSQFDKFSISGGVVDGVSQILELLKYNSDTVYFSPPITAIGEKSTRKNNPVKTDSISEIYRIKVLIKLEKPN